MRPFSSNQNGKTVVAFNIRRKFVIPSAGIKEQCARDYFYDRTGDIDAIFNNWEGRYSSIVRKATAQSGRLSGEDRQFLRFFAYLQYLRTDAMAKQQASAFVEMADFVFDGDAEGRAWATFDPKDIPGESLGHFLKTIPYLGGLADCLILNKTGTDFITSDNPAVASNRFRTQRLKHLLGGSGTISSGYMLTLPLTPRLLYAAYDQGIYSAKLDGNNVVSTSRTADIDALNALQIIRASENVYFGAVDQSAYVVALMQAFEGCRPKAWYKWHFAVENKALGTKTYRAFSEVQTPSELRQGNGFMHIESIAVDPKKWCSIFKFRSNPHYVDTKSAAGLVRSKALLDLRKYLSDLPRPIKVPRTPKNKNTTSA
ncbi:DUF4238 domain-containing protein [Roseomonas sp. KE2513]|nr:DUF4238 domain-containing protein [Roseomonas sp. KE2513]